MVKSKKLIHLSTSKKPMESGMLKMLESEGFVNFAKIMFKMISNSKMRKRVMYVQEAFGKYNDYLGYGIYCYKKAK
jgi:hypothetical protein